MEYLSIHISLAFFFIICSAFFSGSETALFSLSRARLLDYAQQKTKTKQFIVELMRDYQGTLTAIVLGNMFMNASLAISINGIVGHFSHSQMLSLLISLFISLVILLIGGEVTPKAVAILNAEKVANLVAPPLWYYRKAVMPLVLIVQKIHSLLWKIVGRRSQPPLTHDEYYAFVDMAHDMDAFTESEAMMLQQILDFNALKVARLVRSRMDIQCISEGMNAKEVERVIRKSRQKFLPVVKKSIDDAELLLSSKRFFLLSSEERKNWLKKDCCFGAVFIPEQATLRKALPVFSSKGIPAAFAVDEFGGVTGIICKKEIYARVFGEIYEEFERVKWQFKKLGNSTWAIKGNITAEELKKIIPKLDLPDTESSTLSGIIIETLSDFPSTGQELQIGNSSIKITSISGNRINGFEISLTKNDNTEEDI